MKLGKHSKAVKRLGPRYGKRTRERLAKVESMSKSTHKCPYCSYVAARRVAKGIFYCKKCNSKFTGKAYAPIKQKTVKQVKKEKVDFDDELFTKKASKKASKEEQAAKAPDKIEEDKSTSEAEETEAAGQENEQS